MLELARLYMKTEELDQCMNQCMTLLRNDQENDAATVMMADLKFRRNDYDEATYHFRQLLDRKPDHYHALARCRARYYIVPTPCMKPLMLPSQTRRLVESGRQD